MRNKLRSCYDCMAFNFMQDVDICALGFRVKEYVGGGDGTWNCFTEPLDNACTSIPQPQTEEDLWNLCEKLSINPEE